LFRSQERLAEMAGRLPANTGNPREGCLDKPPPPIPESRLMFT